MSMEIDIYQKESDDQYIDWKGRNANPKIHGGIRAAAFACGLILLTIQSHSTRLRPALNLQPSQSQAAFLYTGIYAVAAGAAGINANLPAHGADQLDHSNQRQISAFFNWFFFSLCTGGLISATVMVWVEENKGWNWSFPITVIVLCLALFIFFSGSPFCRHKRPTGSALTRIIKVLTSTARNWKASPDQRLGNQYAVAALNLNRADGDHKFNFFSCLLNGRNVGT
ncbi:hypothetical protein ACLB2K_019958 [Fragaria x ananassa]